MTSSGRKDGLGVGLAIVRRFTDLLGVSLELQSAPGVGTEFTLRLPEAERPPLQAPSIASSVALPEAPLIVLVDDQPAILEAMGTLLESWGCAVIASETGEDALNQLADASLVAALLIIDNSLADGERGADVIDRLRDEVNERVPAVLISGEVFDVPMPEDGEDVVLMTKPVDPGELRAHLQAARGAA